MDTTTASRSEFMLLFRNTQLENRLSTDEMQEAMGRLNDWLRRWSERGHLKSGRPLGAEGKTISGPKGRAVADGPYAEAKEAVGGYVLLEAADLDEAMGVAEEWPLLDYGAAVEVRPVCGQCVPMERAGMQLVELRG